MVSSQFLDYSGASLKNLNSFQKVLMAVKLEVQTELETTRATINSLQKMNDTGIETENIKGWFRHETELLDRMSSVNSSLGEVNAMDSKTNESIKANE